ncbi:MAG TPA: hypothetical protein VIJ71_04865 [Mycobacteriales bacterium]
MLTRRTSFRTARIGLALLATAALAAACGSSSAGSAGSAGSAHATSGAGATSIELSGGHLADNAGRTVYMWVADGPDKSICTGPCTTVWPPVTVSGRPSPGAGLTQSQLTTITRSGGKTQLAYAGHPLYYFAADSAPGDTDGQGSDSFGAKWWMLTDSGHPITTVPTAPVTSASSSAPAGGGGYGY